MEQNTSKNKKNTTKTGNLGENVACEYLKSNGFTILNQNHWQKWGEIDVVAKKGEVVHFVEVKAVTHETKREVEWAVTHETWQPEDKVDQRKLRQIEKALETWISENNYTGQYQIDVIGVHIVPRETYACINYLPNTNDI